MKDGPTIDHNPREPSRRAIKLMAVVTLVLTLVIIIPIHFGVRWAFDALPKEAVYLIDGVIIGLLAGFYFGKWDARHELGLSKPWSPIPVRDYARTAGYLLVRAPFAIFLLPTASWRKARADGDGKFASAMSFLFGLVVGLIITLAVVLIFVIPFQIAFETP